MSVHHMCQWYREFKDGPTYIKNKQCSGRPSVLSETIVKVDETMLKDRRMMVRELCEMIPDVSKTCIDIILTDHLGYAKNCPRWVLRILTEGQKRQQVEVVHKFFQP